MGAERVHGVALDHAGGIRRGVAGGGSAFWAPFTTHSKGARPIAPCRAPLLFFFSLLTGLTGIVGPGCRVAIPLFSLLPSSFSLRRASGAAALAGRCWTLLTLL